MSNTTTDPRVKEILNQLYDLIREALEVTDAKKEAKRCMKMDYNAGRHGAADVNRRQIIKYNSQIKDMKRRLNELESRARRLYY